MPGQIFSRLFTLSFLFFAALPITTPKAWAYPELVRHNYANCNSCHVSPSGGGVLTQYGRQLSAAVQSTWGGEVESESKFAWGVLPLPTWLDAMASYRGVYAYQDTPFIQQGQYIFMEGDAEAALHLGKWYLDATLGYLNPPSADTLSDHVLSRRHFIGINPTEETSLRFGRFFNNYGINTPVHTRFIKQDLAWNESLNQESYNLEAAWIGPIYNLFLTADFGRPDDTDGHHETGAGLTGSVAIADHYKVGVSYFHGDGLSTTRNLVGPWGILGFTPHFYLLSEVDFQQQADKAGSAPSRWGAVDFQKLAYEAVQGVHLHLTQEYSRLSFADHSTLHNAFGAGVDWYPRPHFEFNLKWQKRKTAQIGDNYTDYAWLALNIYI